ncbi:hypothetical protein JF723_05120 [Mycobacterium intracellulare]|nr:hypothetical protein [Mycobacterium intracellulare]MCA2365969.1 hypothetical protein [Mycobacterium intracellulare]
MCAEECPVDAIHYEDDLPPEQLSFQQINAEYFRHHPLEPVTVAAPTKARACPTGLTADGTNDAGRVLGSRRRGSRCVRHRVGRARSTRSHRYQQALCSRDGEPAAGRLRRRQADQRRGRTRKTQRPARAAQCDPADMETLAEHRRRGAQAGCRNRQTPNEIRRCRRGPYGCNVIHSPPHGIVRAVTTAQHEGNSFDD